MEVGVDALPAQRLTRKQGLDGQPAPLAAGFKLVADGPHDVGRVDGDAAATHSGRQVG